MSQERVDRVAIIIPTYGHWDYVSLAIGSAAKTPGAFIIVVDDASPNWISDHYIAGCVPFGFEWEIIRFNKNAGLSRSWNAGLRAARRRGIDFAVCGNSDLVFADGWWDPIRDALESHAIAGPVTNAPGHCADQGVERYLPGYKVSDDPYDIDETAEQCRRENPAAFSRTLLNGFCFAGRVESFFLCGNSRSDVFDPHIPLAGNEDDFFERVKSRGIGACITPRSFVFHYRSVSRGLKGRTIEKGAARIPGCNGCGAAP